MTSRTLAAIAILLACTHAPGAGAPLTAARQDAVAATGDGPWPAPVPGFVPVARDEHPRLLFRRSELPALRQRAETPEGKAILDRLKAILGGGAGDQLKLPTMPPGKDFEQAVRGPFGTWSIYHAAGYGLLFHLTGDRAYADLGRRAADLMYEGTYDAGAYSWAAPESYLRAGPSVMAMALAYDLCFDGWDAAFRQKVANDLLGYSIRKGARSGNSKGASYDITLAQLAKGGNHPATSNHHPSSLGGAGIALLAIQGDTGVDQAQVARHKAAVAAGLATLFRTTQGENGYFFEHQGPGQIGSDMALITALRAYRVADGHDYAARGGPLWLMLRWPAWLMLNAGQVSDKGFGAGTPIYPYMSNPSSYGTSAFTRYGMSRGGQFSQGFGLLTDPDLLAASLWTYKHVVEPAEQSLYGAKFELGGKPSWDAMVHAHRAVQAFVNWPIGIQPKNPAGIIPRTSGDPVLGFYHFRNRWQDADDILFCALLGGRADGQSTFKGFALGEEIACAPFATGPKATHYVGYEDGSGCLSQGATALAIDYSRTAPADAIVVIAGGGRKPPPSGGKRFRSTALTVGGSAATVLVFAADGRFPVPAAAGNAVTVGSQRFTLDGGRIAIATTGKIIAGGR